MSALLKARENKPADQPAIDLVLMVESRDLAKATLNSLFASGIALAKNCCLESASASGPRNEKSSRTRFCAVSKSPLQNAAS